MKINKDEVMEAYEKAWGDDRTAKGELLIKVGKDCDKYELFLKVGGNAVKLEKTEIRVFRDVIDGNGNWNVIFKNYDGDHKNRFVL